MLYKIDEYIANTWQNMSRTIPAIDRINTEGSNKVPNFPKLGIQLFTSLLNGDAEIVNDHEIDELWQSTIHNALSNTIDWQSVLAYTDNNKANSIVAATRLLNYVPGSLSLSVEDNLPTLKTRLEQAQKLGVNSLVRKYQDQISAATSRYQDFANSVNLDWTSTAVAEVLSVFKGTLAPDNGFDDLPGVDASMNMEDRVNAINAYSSSRVQQILRKLSSLSQALGKGGKNKTNKKAKQGIAYGRDLDSLVVDEWLKSENQFSLDYAEEKLTQYNHSIEQTIKGPIILLLDQSASMNEQGCKIGDDKYDVWAKAFMLLIAQTAKRESRQVFCIPFDTRAKNIIDLRKAKAKEVTNLLNAYADGSGTKWAMAINKAVDVLKGKDKSVKLKSADIILITDGVDEIELDYQAKLKQLKTQLKFKIQGILINNESEQTAALSYSATNKLKTVADTVVRISSLTDENKLSVVINSL